MHEDMNEELLIEVLAAHAEHLNAEEDHTQTYLEMFPEDEEALLPLFTLARDLKTVLAQAEMSPAFREQLYAALVQAAEDILPAPVWRSRLPSRPRLPERILDLPVFVRLPAAPDRQVLVRAAAGGAGLAAAGVAAYVLRERFFSEETPITPVGGD